MDRREFLKGGGTLLAGIFLLSNPWIGFLGGRLDPSSRKNTFRSTSGGDVYVTKDAGKSWQLHYRLGPEVAVTHIRHGRNGQVLLTASHQAHPFFLSLSRDGKYWQSAPLSLSTLLALI